MANRSGENVYVEFTHWFSQTWDDKGCEIKLLPLYKYPNLYVPQTPLYIHMYIYLSLSPCLLHHWFNQRPAQAFSFWWHCDLYRASQIVQLFGFWVCFRSILFIEISYSLSLYLVFPLVFCCYECCDFDLKLFSIFLTESKLSVSPCNGKFSLSPVNRSAEKSLQHCLSRLFPMIWL